MNNVKNMILALSIILLIFKVQGTAKQIERTFAMIKPYAVLQKKASEIIEFIQKAGFTIIAIKQLTLTIQDVNHLYENKKNRRWFHNYLRAMIASPVIVMILEKENAVKDWDCYKKIIREQYFTICKKNNIAHGSDSLEDAQREIALFFK